jgi:Rod binding domain-containing protein
MMINEIGSISGKNFTANNFQGNNIAKTNSGLIPLGGAIAQPKNDVNNQNIKLKEACTQFEQIFIKYMVDKMWSSTETAGSKQTIEKSVWQDYFNNEISKVIAESNMTGISDTLFDQLEALGSIGQQALPAEDDMNGEAETADAKNEESIN